MTAFDTTGPGEYAVGGQASIVPGAQGLADILLELAEADLDFDIGAVGFFVAEIDFMIDGLGNERPDTADMLPEPGPAICSVGDRWQLGTHVVVSASALDAATIRY